MLCQGGKYNHGPQATHHHIQERCRHIVTKTPRNPIKNTSVQGQNHIQTPYQTYSLQTGYPHKTTMKTKMRKLRGCR